MKTGNVLWILTVLIFGLGLLIAAYFIYLSPCEESTVVIPPEAEKVVALAIDDLATRLKISPKEVLVIGLEKVQWPDSCLGIHEPGVQCLDVITPGYRLFLRAGGKIWVYHTGENSVRRVNVP